MAYVRRARVRVLADVVLALWLPRRWRERAGLGAGQSVRPRPCQAGGVKRRLALIPAVLAPSSFGLAALFGARRVPGYRHRDEPMSALAAKQCQGAPIMVPGFLALGASTWALAGALDDTRVPRPIPSMMRTAAAAIVGAGVARQSDRSCPVRFMGDENVTLSDDLHVLISMVAFGSWIMMPFVAAARGRALHPPERLVSLAFGAVALGGWVWTSALVRRGSQTWGGVAQRVTVGAALGWYSVAAIVASR